MYQTAAKAGRSPLIGVEALRDRLPGGDLLTVDCRYNLADPHAGLQSYRSGHIPGALYAHLGADLSGPGTPEQGRHPLPERQCLAGRFGRWGIGTDTQVVAYDDAGGLFAARLWWLLRWLGHANVQVLDGGRQAWQAAGGPVTGEVPEPIAARFEIRPPLVTDVPVEIVEQASQGGAGLLIDARAPERYAGITEPIDPVAGHIPGALNRAATDNLTSEGRFKPADQLRQEWRQLSGGADAAQSIHYCGSGVTACHNLLALAVAGLSGGRLYAPSWSGWIAHMASTASAVPESGSSTE
ncbi:MAG: sulfurtransferase [Pseudomonadota bacterium]|nr:sulfurtransferase [Pseudomonadota bacterium]